MHLVKLPISLLTMSFLNSDDITNLKTKIKKKNKQTKKKNNNKTKQNKQTIKKRAINVWSRIVH